MPVIANLSGIIIRLLSLPLLGTRLHAFHGDTEVVLDLDNLRWLSTTPPARLREPVMEWARRHRWEILRSLSGARAPFRAA